MDGFIETLSKELNLPKWAVWGFVGAIAVIMILEALGVPKLEPWEEK